MRRIVILAVVAAWSVCRADQICITSDKGVTYGPFDVKAGAVLNFGDATFTITKVKTAPNRILEAMEAIRIPEIDFRAANIRDVVEFLSEASVEFDKSNKRVNIVLLLGPDKPEVPLITFRARDITLLEAVKLVCKVANLKYFVRDGVVMIASTNEPEGSIVTRRYDVSPTVQDRFIQGGCPGLRNKEKDQVRSVNDQLQDYFTQLGVKWPSGSSICHLQNIGKLVVSNTEDNLVTFEQALAESGLNPSQIEAEMRFVSFDLADVSKLAAEGTFLQDSLIRLWKDGRGTLLAAPKVVTKNGCEASVKGVTECIYPTSFSIVSGCGHEILSGTNAVAARGVPAVEPQDFETRECGVIFTVMPEVYFDGRTINLTVTPEMVEEPVWQDYGQTYTDAAGKEQHLTMKQPFFHTQQFSTSVQIRDGATVLVGGGMPSRDGKKAVYAFVTAKLIDLAGKPLKAKVQAQVPPVGCE